MDVRIRPSALAGTTRAPGSKSYTHRAILAAGYADGAQIESPLLSADTQATIDAVESFGAEVTAAGGNLSVTGFDGQPSVPEDVIDCENSGTTMRLVTAAAALVEGTSVVTGDESLRSRPQGPLLDAIEQLDGRAKSTRANGRAPLIVEGPIEGGTVRIPGDVSSQFVTALLMAGTVTDRGIEIQLTTDLKSAPYVDVTREVLDAFGIETEHAPSKFSVSGEQSYRAEGDSYSVPGDFSSISYLLAAGVLAAQDEQSVSITGAYPSAQGDTAIVQIVQEMGGDVTWEQEEGELTVRRSSLTGTTVDVGDTPDLLPTIAVLGAVGDGTTHITNAEHVRYKETDRVAAMAKTLEQLGAVLEEGPDSLTIYGGDSTIVGGTVDGHRDHRIIMALAIAGLVADGETTITGAEHVDVSFPNFFDVLADLGAAIKV